MKRVALYVRVSTQEQAKHGLSVDSQIIALQEYAMNNRMEIVGIYNDAGFSANKKYTTRPALLKLLGDCNAGKIDQIIFTKLDRWFRNVGDYYEVQSILDQNQVSWRAIWEDYETETSSGIFKVNIMLSVAQNEADRTKERVRSAMEFKKARGDYIGKAPTGYIVRGKDLIKDPEKEQGMKALFEEYLISFSMRKAMEKASEYGVTFDRLHLLKLIRNPAYHGEASNGYKCDPYITKEQHDLIIENIGRSSRRPKVEGRVYIFSGLIRCEYCGKRMAGHTVKRIRKNETFFYQKYDCTSSTTTKMVHPHIQVTEKHIEKYLLDQLDNALHDRIIEVETINDDHGINDQIRQKKNLEAKLQRLAILFEDGDISAETYRSKRDAIKAQLASIYIEPVKAPEKLPDNWKELYQGLDPDDRKSFWKSFIKAIYISNENKDHPRIEFM